jgi:LAO/AO transport system kinase
LQLKNNVNYIAATFESEMNIHSNRATNWQNILKSLQLGDVRALARMISLVENEMPGYLLAMGELPGNSECRITGITGPPGAGKSSLVDLLVAEWIERGKKVGVLCVDPSSPFHSGALLGDRIRMSKWYTHPGVFIRSLTTRGSLGGLHPKMIEISDLLKAASFDCILVETVGVGQSEVEIAGLADTTVVVLVPESGDEIQVMKAGLLEIADIFVINKSDRPGADEFVSNLLQGAGKIPVIKTIATQKTGIAELMEMIMRQQQSTNQIQHKSVLLAEKAYQLILHNRMKDISKNDLKEKIQEKLKGPGFNLYQFVSSY